MGWTKVTPAGQKAFPKVEQLPENVAAAFRKYFFYKNLASRVDLAREIYRWYGQGSQCDKALLAELLTRLNKDIGMDVEVEAGTILRAPAIIIPLDAIPNHAIAVKVCNASDCDLFIDQVRSALTSILNGPYGFGAALLQGIIESKQANWTYVTCIRRGNNKCEREKDNQPTPSCVLWEPTRDEVGDGTGKRSPFIGLAHELLHAYHFGCGVNRGGALEEAMTVGLSSWWKDPQEMTLRGIDFKQPRYLSWDLAEVEMKVYNAESKEWKSKKIQPYWRAYRHVTENMIRFENNEDLRLFYSGQVKLDDTAGAVDYAKKLKIYKKMKGYEASAGRA